LRGGLARVDEGDYRSARRKDALTPTPRAPHPVLKEYYEADDDRQPFVTALFDATARHYDRLCSVMSLGSGRSYRRGVLVRAGLKPGMHVLDVATGTGLVARSAWKVLGDDGAVVGLDPSRGMLQEARKVVRGPLVQGIVEHLPFANERFDIVSMGYALRHMADLGVAFRECRRVLKPGGRFVILEISRPRSAVSQWFVRAYLQRILPLLMRLSRADARTGLLSRYYWDTIAACVPPDTILEVLRSSGFVDVERRLRGGLLSEYAGVRSRG
jgi:demethylmenaquinone methyltransferase/2-methoxy-6-polyprenyl-1,4-benzoquinol methylase